ncbi:hypothetical protein FSP39_022222 [Pinctada imbricata]|uniref:UBC core domain-containing protein n=1 Tax=Pinctada imbricata TaxID=66713 RepID=A0AA88XTT7_PINIB|nr:hypothetical protein FSP39_022222 [Pinctada imbricata]
MCRKIQIRLSKQKLRRVSLWNLTRWKRKKLMRIMKTLNLRKKKKMKKKLSAKQRKFSHAPRKKRKTKTSKKAERKTKAEAKFYPPFPTCQPGEKLTVEVCYTFSKADVMWQNGDIERDIPSTDLVPIHHLDELEFFPGDFVVPEKDGTTEKYGVVVNCDHIERTCLVRWMKVVDLAKGERPDKDYEEEEVSVYDIKDHPDFKFRPSQAVIRVGEPLDANECKFTAGQISKLDPTGTLIVKWPDGKESRCYPQELYIALEELDESDSSWSTVGSDSDDSDSTDSMDSWETENEEEVESDAEEERKSDKEKPLIISREKKDELLDFLAVTEDSLRTLKNVFKNEDSLRTLKEFLKEEDGQPPVYTSYGNLKGIMHLYRKCQDMEKFLKSSYFEGQKLKDLIEELKEYLKEEKRNERNDRILSIHKTRQSSSSVSNKENQEQSDVSGNEKSVVVNGDLVVEEDDSGVSFTCSGEKSSLSSSNEPEQKSVLSDSSCTENNVPSNNSNGESAEVSSTENNLSSSCTNGELEDIKSSGAKSQSDLPNPGEKLAKKAKLCHEIVSELLSRMKLFKDAIKRRWSLTMKETENALAKFSKGDSKSSSADDAAPEGGKGAMNDKTPEGDKAAMNGLDKKAESSEEEETKFKKQIEKMDPDDIKNMLMSIVQSEDRRGCEILEEVLLGIDTDKSKVKNAWNEMSTNVINFKDIITSDIEGLHLMEEVPLAHKFCSKEYSPGNPKSFTTALSKELKLLQSSLPNGIIVKAYEDRMDLFSVMIVGPPGTPYEDALFFFDVQVPGDYPSSPPEFHYISYCKDRLNPNLYEDGKVCVSLLGTWSGKGNETWTDKSNLLQALVSIQGLILVAEPYYNEAGYEKQRGSQQGLENSKMYNEMAILKVVQSTARMISNPPHSFLQEMTSHLRVRGPRMAERLEAWINSSSEPTLSSSKPEPKVDNSESESAMSGKTSGILSVAYSKSVDNIEHSDEVLARSKDSFPDSNTDSYIKSEEASMPTEEMQTNSSDKACMNNPQHSEEILACSKDSSIECKIKSEETSMPTEEMQTNSSDKACVDNSHDEKCLSTINMPEFPLLPASKGFCITMKKNLQSLRNSLEQLSN